MKSFPVFLTDSAASDLEEIIAYVGGHDSPEKADYVLRKMEQVFHSLSTTPERGAYTDELRSLGIRDYSEVFFEPYRIIYRIVGNRAYVLVIAGGRGDMQALPQRRLLEAWNSL